MTVIVVHKCHLTFITPTKYHLTFSEACARAVGCIIIPNLENSGETKTEVRQQERNRDRSGRETEIPQTGILSGTPGSLSFSSHHGLLIQEG